MTTFEQAPEFYRGESDTQADEAVIQADQDGKWDAFMAFDDQYRANDERIAFGD